jgi:hypothetical protein
MSMASTLCTWAFMKVVWANTLSTIEHTAYAMSMASTLCTWAFEKGVWANTFSTIEHTAYAYIM